MRDGLHNTLRGVFARRSMMNSRVIAVDFDGCLCGNRWPKIGEANKAAIRALIRLRDNGARLILWTCRTGALLDEAVSWCERHGLTFDAVNDNLPEHIEMFGGDTRKVFATEYWDDRARIVKYRRGDAV